MKNAILIVFLLCIGACTSSEKEEEEVYQPIPASLEIPAIFQQKLIAPIVPTTNPLTEEGIALGKKLFFDTILSKNNTQSCASCHFPEKAFADTARFSTGVDGQLGNRNSMPLFNLAWNFGERFAWDGKELSLERQVLEPVQNPVELHGDWKEIATQLQNHPEYPTLFTQAFGTTTIDSTLVAKAIAQFERTLISGNSKFDQYLLGNIELTPQELNGFQVFMDEDRGDCFHCHGSNNNPLWTDNAFHNNALDATFTDLGLGKITGDPNDNGKFRSPSLRNLKFTAPYMHDGRFETLEDVMTHYNSGIQRSETLSPLILEADNLKTNPTGAQGLNLSPIEVDAIIAFLHTLTDESFLGNPDLSDPFTGVTR